MKITIDDLYKYGACKEGIRFFEKNYPNGAEVSEVIANPDITLEMLHFGAKYLSVSEEEKQLYKSRCNIDKSSKHVLYSNEITSSEAIIYSNNVLYSNCVRNSSWVKESSFVYGSDNINDSNEILNSRFVDESIKVIGSNHIENCDNILNSDYIKWSKYVSRSFNIEDSSFLYVSENVQDCHFGGFLKNCKHCLFCFGLTDKEYCIFNKEVDLDEYKAVLKELIYKLKLEHPNFIEIKEKEYLSEDRFLLNDRLDGVFDGLSEDFYGWIGTIEYFDDIEFLRLFFRDKNLKK